MPIYEYRCSSCGRQHEVLQKLSEAPPITCPSCGKETLTKLVSAAGFQLKGSGWYVTDFRSSGKRPAKPEGAATDAKPSENKTDAGTPDAKPAEPKPAETKSATAAPVATAADTAGTTRR
jgi:putative FmdB family regulatory protein